MKASKLIVGGLGLGMLVVSLSACTYYERNRRVVIDPRSDAELAAACVAAFEPDGKAAQVMTYDSETRTETHVNTQGRKVTVTAQNATDNTSMGMGGTLGESRPESCTDTDPVPRKSRPRNNYKNSYDGYR